MSRPAAGGGIAKHGLSVPPPCLAWASGMFPREQREAEIPATFPASPFRAAGNRGNTTMATKGPSPIINLNDYLEYMSELHQDDARDGFQNLGSSDNFHFQLSGTAPKMINGQ